MLSTIVHNVANWRRYRAGVRELASLDDRSLSDIGIHRSQIKQVAKSGSRG
jgi:uncharacterized protein YjiS (DUF1127 family)